MKIKDAADDVLIKKYIALRDRRSERKRAFEVDDEVDKNAMGKIENDMLRRLNERGTDSSTVRGVGVAFKKHGRIVPSPIGTSFSGTFRKTKHGACSPMPPARTPYPSSRRRTMTSRGLTGRRLSQ